MMNHYTYLHRDPRTMEVVYIGHGKQGRAWAFGSYRPNTGDASRSVEHKQWALEVETAGYVSDQFVEILAKKLSKSEANELEQSYIRDLRPRFNVPQGLHLLKMVPELVATAKQLRDTGLSYKAIANEIGVSTMSVYRALTRRTKNVV